MKNLAYATALLIPALIGTDIGHAAVIMHSDLASYEAALPAGSLTTFDDFSGGWTENGTDLTFASGIVSTAHPAAIDGNYMTGMEFRGSVDSNGDYFPISILWTLLPGTFAFGFDIRHVNKPILPFSTSPSETVNLTIDNGSGAQTFLLHQFLAEGELTNAGFIGFSGSAPIRSVMFSGTGAIGSDVFFIDNLRTAYTPPPPAVPLPGGLPLALGGLGILAAARGQVRRQKAT